MTVKNNPVLGTIACIECEDQATVHAAKRGSGRFLYTRCPNCGTDQKTGAKFQTRIFNGTQWRGEVITPPNLIEQAQGEPEAAQQAEKTTQGDWSPEEKEAKSDENSGDGGLFFAALALGVGVLGAFAGVSR